MPSESHAPSPEDDTLRAQIRATGLRATRARLTVLRMLHGLEAPASHPEIAEALSDDGWDRSTLYRNLVDLTEVGLLRRVDVGDHVWRFELATTPTHRDAEHPHFLCTSCGEVSCLPELANLQPAGDVPRALKEGRVSIQFRGQCDTCEGSTTG